MAESKYGKYIITEHLTDEETARKRKKEGRKERKRELGVPFPARLLYLGEENFNQDTFNVNVVTFEPGSKPLSPWAKVHQHDEDEILAFLGTNPKDPKDLGGEVEIWLEDEKFVLTKSFLVYVPKGLKHCPLSINRVDTPIIHFHVIAGTSAYTSNEERDD